MARYLLTGESFGEIRELLKIKSLKQLKKEFIFTFHDFVDIWLNFDDLSSRDMFKEYV